MAPTSTRSASISSSSTSSSKSQAPEMKKKFSCSFAGCGKSFSRSEHLHRHALNHKEGTNTCMRCSAHFRRRDLLDRHMARHKEKDDEAGGEGLGVLATRKRLWRDADGKIVNTRRPSVTQSQDGAAGRPSCRVEKSSKTGDRKMRAHMSRVPSVSASSTIVVDTGKFEYPDPEPQQTPSWLEMGLPSSPSTEPSLHSTTESPPAELSDLDALYEDAPWPLDDTLPHIEPPSPLDAQSPYLTPGSWGMPQPFQTFMGAAELPYADVLKPMTGIYDWQPWTNQVMLSRCREEKFEPKFEPDEKRDWATPYQHERRHFGLGMC